MRVNIAFYCRVYSNQFKTAEGNNINKIKQRWGERRSIHKFKSRFEYFVNWT